jgi:glycosyltransferase involved in cell wall biosynthesis
MVHEAPTIGKRIKKRIFRNSIPAAKHETVTVDIVVPVLNEEAALPRCISALIKYLSGKTDFEWMIVIADNGSTDRTWEIALELAAKDQKIQVTKLEKRGRGGALKKAWIQSDADVCCYMDADLSTSLDHLQPLIRAVADDGYDLAIGSRLISGARVTGRSLRREFTSRMYNLLFRTLFNTKIRDAQCGFKAISANAAKELLPLVKDNGWFFDTELLIIGEQSEYRIKELPVTWEDDRNSSVNILSTGWHDVKGLLRLRFGGVPRPAVHHIDEHYNHKSYG